MGLHVPLNLALFWGAIHPVPYKLGDTPVFGGGSANCYWRKRRSLCILLRSKHTTSRRNTSMPDSTTAEWCLARRYDLTSHEPDAATPARTASPPDDRRGDQWAQQALARTFGPACCRSRLRIEPFSRPRRPIACSQGRRLDATASSSVPTFRPADSAHLATGWPVSHCFPPFSCQSAQASRRGPRGVYAEAHGCRLLPGHAKPVLPG